jgi:hypothetical protein
VIEVIIKKDLYFLPVLGASTRRGDILKLKLGACKGPIDPGIKNLIAAMNKTGYLQTICSCEGHQDREEEPYVSFVCRATDINQLCKVLNEAEQKAAEDQGLVLTFNLSIVYDKDIINCQESIPEGYLSLDLQFYIDEDMWETKGQVFKILEDCFNRAQEPSSQPSNVIPFKRPTHTDNTQ